ncbi:hypothetical protein BVC80_8027g3 [Macleaya cordata]|uniref:Uncharacterized protein n=1 Tax=Macleaya cordata TaxID=56857 RepID=A0A200QMY7_MACCD|nr:hypothetical protein BVC80_8027g3 [Macleaya cordata]
MMVVKDVLLDFQSRTGLKINLETSVVVGVCDVHNTSEECAQILECMIAELPLKYLGIPIGASTRAKKIWDDIIEKMSVKLPIYF